MMSGMSAPKMFSSVSTSAWDTQLAGAMGQSGAIKRRKDEAFGVSEIGVWPSLIFFLKIGSRENDLNLNQIRTK